MQFYTKSFYINSFPIYLFPQLFWFWFVTDIWITLRQYKEDFPQKKTITAKLGGLQYKCIEY